MDEETRQTVIFKAIESAGPVGEDSAAWQNKVIETASRITAMLSERSQVSRVIEAIEGSKVFHATVTELKLEKSSQRVLVTLATRPSDNNPDGIEVARTERIDNSLGLSMANRLKAIKGHKVLLWVENQQMASSNKSVRVITHFEDLGVDKNAEVEDAA